MTTAAAGSSSAVEVDVTRGQPIYFGPARRPLFGWYHPPQGPVKRCSVLVCPPTAYEGVQAFRSMKALSELLAGAGFATLRIDYDGSGDSAGDDFDPGRLEAWISSVRRGTERLRELSGAPDVCLFGTRLGGTLAVLASADEPVSRLALWAPCLSGRRYVREREIIATRGIDGEVVPPGDVEGIVEAAGFVLTAETVDELGGVELLEDARTRASKVLLIERDDRPSDGAFAAHLSSLGADVETARLPGLAPMLVPPRGSAVPYAVFSKVLAWLSDVATLDAAPDVAGPAPAPVLETEGVRERPVFFGEDARQFGILTESGQGADPRRPGVVLVPGGAVHRVSANRMYVALARTLARRGFPVLRMDVPGIGDSRQKPGLRENEPLTPALVDGVTAAMATLGAEAGVDSFVVFGLCSGGFGALQTALSGAGGIREIVVVNPLRLYPEEVEDGEDNLVRNAAEADRYRRNLTDPAAWRRLASGKISPLRAVRLLTSKIRLRARVALAGLGSGGGAGGAGAGPNLDADLRALAARSVFLNLVFSVDDRGFEPFMLRAKRAVEDLGAKGELTLKMIPDADHTFSPLRARTEVIDYVVGQLDERYGSASDSR